MELQTFDGSYGGEDCGMGWNGPHVMGDFWERETRKITVRYNKMTRKAGGFANFIIFYSIFIRIYTHNTTQPTFYDMFVCLKMIRVSQKISNCVFLVPYFQTNPNGQLTGIWQVSLVLLPQYPYHGIWTGYDWI